MRHTCIVLLFLIANLGYTQSQEEQLAYQYFSNKQYEKAIVIYKNLYKESPKREFYESLITSYLFLERYKEAEKLVKNYIKKNHC